MFTAVMSAKSQLAAPGAFSDFGGCSHDTCTWVPFAHKKVYQRGNLRYTVKIPENEDDGTFELRQGEKVLLSTELKDLSASVSVAWTPASHWFAVTWSNGGAIGGFNTRVFHITGDEVKEMDAPIAAFQSFRRRYSCKARGENLQAYRWDKSAEALVLVISVYPTSDCGPEMGHTEAYFVSPMDGRILRHMNLPQFKAYMRRYPVW